MTDLPDTVESLLSERARILARPATLFRLRKLADVMRRLHAMGWESPQDRAVRERALSLAEEVGIG